MASITGPELSKGIGRLLHDNRLRVPFYQRSYAWKKAEVTELFHDLRRALEDENRKYYFLGSIVGCEQAIGPEDHNEAGAYEIVDGQQRLATTTILLAAIRDHLLVLERPEDALHIEREFLFKKEGFQKPEIHYRLTLSETDDKYFREQILAAPKDRPQAHNGKLRPSHKLISEAARHAADFVAEITGTRSTPEQLGVFDRWTKFILNDARVIFILVPDAAEAYIVFETLNDRGLDLTIADLTKNHLFAMAGKGHIDEARSSWIHMTGVLLGSTESEITKTYIHHFWSSIHGATHGPELFRDLRKKIINDEEAVRFLGALAENAEYYAAIRNSNADFWAGCTQTTRKSVFVLNQLGVTQVGILLLAVLDTFKDRRHEIDKLMPCFVWWTVRLMIAGGSPGDAETNYSARAVRLRKGEFADADALIESMAEFVPNDQKFYASFCVETTTRKMGRYFLQCIQRVKDNMPSPHLADDDQTEGSLEHILPKRPHPDHWSVSEQDVERLLWRIGNLALLQDKIGSHIGNQSFRIKKPFYEHSPYGFTKELNKLGDDWGETEIDSRQRVMADLALKAWPLKPPATPTTKKRKTKS